MTTPLSANECIERLSSTLEVNNWHETVFGICFDDHTFRLWQPSPFRKRPLPILSGAVVEENGQTNIFYEFPSPLFLTKIGKLLLGVILIGLLVSLSMTISETEIESAVVLFLFSIVVLAYVFGVNKMYGRSEKTLVTFLIKTLDATKDCEWQHK